MLPIHVACDHPTCNTKASCPCPCQHCRDNVELALKDIDEKISDLYKRVELLEERTNKGSN